MLIFIDESGSFVVPTHGKWSVCCVAALVIPGASYSLIIDEFETLKKEWGVIGKEIKGRDLHENEIVSMIRLLNKFDVILEVVAIDMGLQTRSGISAHKLRQAERIMENLTPAHRPELINSLKELQARIRSLPDQLYTQATLMTCLVRKLLQDVTLYYAQRQPKELDVFEWIIDAKDKKALTEYETLWCGTVKPYLEGNSPPLYRLRGADYSYFYKFTGTRKKPPRHLRGRFKSEPFDYIRIDKIMKNICFQPSENEPGLQLVDIVCNACKRALNGKLNATGWEFLGCLIVQAQKGQQEIPLVDLSHHGRIPIDSNQPYFHVLQAIKRIRKQMLV
ncbi:DUF3800 domain-containing protein [Nitrospira sp. Nam80]